MAPVVSAKTAKGSVFLAQPQFVGGVRDSIVFFFSRKLQSVGSTPSPSLADSREGRVQSLTTRVCVCVPTLLS